MCAAGCYRRRVHARARSGSRQRHLRSTPAPVRAATLTLEVGALGNQQVQCLSSDQPRCGLRKHAGNRRGGRRVGGSTRHARDECTRRQRSGKRAARMLPAAACRSPPQRWPPTRQRPGRRRSTGGRAPWLVADAGGGGGATAGTEVEAAAQGGGACWRRAGRRLCRAGHAAALASNPAAIFRPLGRRLLAREEPQEAATAEVQQPLAPQAGWD